MHEEVQARGTSQAGNNSQPTDNNISSEVQHIFAEAKDFNATIKKSVIAQFSTNLDIMYQEKNKTSKADKIARKIEHIKELQWKKKPKRKKVVAKADTTDLDVETVIEENNEVNISGRRLTKLKGILKSLLYNHDAETINKQDIEISDLSEKEFSVCLIRYYNFPERI
ncbi:hypothetical protein G6F70_002976 [Rhizopus microsporus]|nr:hypothetical protein G6F71_003582 [Rhizopus microsporus]KAG1201643.1 hypothetical protein G6F70_002976 [Rhizopus microsporus]KAG1213683.1 hypothetical protein G6F69_002607 [Rhizopus microsporus]KAG1235644.1 hypothetical protein G6F67_002612 [Rhizopus microsporus]KAG1267899.1 hypothetical protein G6F68_001549 [Rhizopus microsporus]